MNSNRKDSKLFWKILNKLEKKPNETIFKKAISSTRWTEHFRSLFTTKNDATFPISPNETGCLDYEITLEELKMSSYILKPMKASGIDGISNEMISCLLIANPDAILKLFNKVLLSNTPITTWCTSIISPIHKKGSKMNPDNYRAIALACCMEFFFAAVLNQRLLKFAMENGIISENQLGFMPGNRTSDALIVLFNLVQTYCLKKKHTFMPVL